MLRISLIFFLVIFFQTTFAQKISVEMTPEEDRKVAPVKEEDKQIVSSEESVVVAVTESKSIELGVEMFEKFEAYDSFEKVVQNFPGLNCKNRYSNPLELLCYECSYSSANTDWVLEFHRKEVGDENCDLASIKKVDALKTQFEKKKNEFRELIEKKFGVSFSKAGEKSVAGTALEDFQVFKMKVFSNEANRFEETLVSQLRFIHSMANQTKINNAVETLNSAFRSLSEKVKEEFSTALFPDEGSRLRRENFDLFFSKEVGDITANEIESLDDEQLEEKAKEKAAKEFKFLKSVFHHYLNPELKDYQKCYEEMATSKLPINVSSQVAEELKVYEFLNIKKVSNDPRKDLTEDVEKNKLEDLKINELFLVEWNADYKKSNVKDYICSASKSVFSELFKDGQDVSCDQLPDSFLSYEKKYKDFFKGKEDQGFKMYRSKLVVDLLQASEAKYFKELQLMNLLSKEEKPSNEKLKEASQSVEYAYSQVTEYMDELESLLPYLGESLRMRKDWMLKGVKNKEVFNLCKN